VHLALAGAGSWPLVVVPSGVRSLASGGPIVCGVVGSGPSITAARVVARLADSIGADLDLVKAIDPRERAAEDFDEIGAMRRIATSRRLRRAADRSPGAATTRLLVEEGAPVDVLVAAAQRESALLLALGSRGRSSTVGALLGSVASAVALTARTPVLIVPARHSVRMRRSEHRMSAGPHCRARLPVAPSVAR
jgi:nucleotide-binding universal stress UspA family protein